MSWTEEQVLALAPDAASAKAGKDLAREDKWVLLEKNAKAVWGKCKGSGSTPYQTQVDLGNTAFKCSCPSRKFPCKHGIGLLLLYARKSNNFNEAELPEWVSEWLTKRAEKEEKKAEKEVKEIKSVDVSAQAKRQAKRTSNVLNGIDELLLWLKDIIRSGLLNLPDKPLTYWESQSKRLIDAQAPGLAAMVRKLGSTDFFKEGWQSKFLDQLLSIYLVAKGFQQLEHLPEDLQEDVKSFIGFTHSQEELKEQEGIVDHWLILSKQVNQEDNLTTESYWLYGQESQRYALVLQFFVRGQSGSLVLTPGTSVHAELVFYPSVTPLRAIVKTQMAFGKAEGVAGYESWQQVAAEEAKISSLLPFRNERPFIVDHVRPVWHQQKWWLTDKDNHLVQLSDRFTNTYKWLAISGGKEVTMAVLGKENSFEPLGLWFNQAYYIL